MIKKLIAALLSVVLLQGCISTNPFAKFYYDQTGGADLSISPHVVSSSGKPQIYRGSDQEQDSLKMCENGYLLIGYSSFNAGNVKEKGAIKQAKKIHAAVVILYSTHTGTISGSMPLTLPNTQMSSTSLQGNIYGSGGSTSYSGNAYTTTYGTTTTYVPYTVHRYEYFATYWIKGKPAVFGAYFKDLTPEIRRQIGSNKGALVTAVVKGSPAFEADIFKGDVLKKVGNIAIFDKDSLRNACDKYAGKETDILIIREGKELHKTVKLRMRN